MDRLFRFRTAKILADMPVPVNSRKLKTWPLPKRGGKVGRVPTGYFVGSLQSFKAALWSLKPTASMRLSGEKAPPFQDAQPGNILGPSSVHVAGRLRNVGTDQAATEVAEFLARALAPSMTAGMI